MTLLRKLATVASVLGLVLGLSLAAEGTARAAVLDFEGIDAACDATNPATAGVPVGYGGLTWSQYSAAINLAADVQVECDENYQNTYANSYGAPSPSYAAYNAYGYGEVDANLNFGTFTYGGASFSSFAYADGFDVFSAYSLAVLGYKPGDPFFAPSYSDTFDLLSDQYITQSVNWTGLNLLVFLVGDGLASEQATVFGADGRSFLMDDVDITIEEQQLPVPEPASLVLFGTGIVAAARARKRRQSGLVLQA